MYCVARNVRLVTRNPDFSAQIRTALSSCAPFSTRALLGAHPFDRPNKTKFTPRIPKQNWCYYSYAEALMHNKSPLFGYADINGARIEHQQFSGIALRGIDWAGDIAATPAMVPSALGPASLTRRATWASRSFMWLQCEAFIVTSPRDSAVSRAIVNMR